MPYAPTFLHTRFFFTTSLHPLLSLVPHFFVSLHPLSSRRFSQYIHPAFWWQKRPTNTSTSTKKLSRNTVITVVDHKNHPFCNNYGTQHPNTTQYSDWLSSIWKGPVSSVHANSLCGVCHCAGSHKTLCSTCMKTEHAIDITWGVEGMFGVPIAAQREREWIVADILRMGLSTLKVLNYCDIKYISFLNLDFKIKSVSFIQI